MDPNVLFYYKNDKYSRNGRILAILLAALVASTVLQRPSQLATGLGELRICEKTNLAVHFHIGITLLKISSIPLIKIKMISTLCSKR